MPVPLHLPIAVPVMIYQYHWLTAVPAVTVANDLSPKDHPLYVRPQIALLLLYSLSLLPQFSPLLLPLYSLPLPPQVAPALVPLRSLLLLPQVVPLLLLSRSLSLLPQAAPALYSLSLPLQVAPAHLPKKSAYGLLPLPAERQALLPPTHFPVDWFPLQYSV